MTIETIDLLSSGPVEPEVPRSRLSHALASEWTKIRSVQSTMWTLAAMFALVLGLGLLGDSYEYGRVDGSPTSTTAWAASSSARSRWSPWACWWSPRSTAPG